MCKGRKSPSIDREANIERLEELIAGMNSQELSEFFALVSQLSEIREQQRCGHKIKDTREALGMTLEDLAAKSGTSYETLSGLESGIINSISSKALLRIAAALNTTVEQMFFSTSSKCPVGGV